jgi:hypothetical protein
MLALVLECAAPDLRHNVIFSCVGSRRTYLKTVIAWVPLKRLISKLPESLLELSITLKTLLPRESAQGSSKKRFLFCFFLTFLGGELLVFLEGVVGG